MNLTIKRKIDEKGRIVLPLEVMKALNVGKGDEVLLYVYKGRIVIDKK